MKRTRILVDSLADEQNFNAQMTSARDIVARLNPERFDVRIFHVADSDRRIVKRPNTRLISLPQKRQTVRILREFIFGDHEILFYVKTSPAARAYFSLRSAWRDRRVTIGTVESQSDLRNEPTIKPEQIRIWEQTILRSDHLFSNSHSVQKSLQAEYRLASEVVPTGVDTHYFTPAYDRIANSRARVLFVGSLRPFKGPQVLLEAAARFRESDFVIAGDGLMAKELEQRAESERLFNVKFVRGLSADALREEYRRADIFLFPSTWEGSPKVILEAAACGLPVVARSSYQPESVINDETGYLVAGDEELFARLKDLISSPTLRSTLGRASRAHAEKFDWDPITRQWEDIFLRLAPVHAK
jgi:glycosyltransferase involved in cell wall biosynthesis